MKLLNLAVKNVRSLPDGDYSMADRKTGAPLDVALVIGGAASGKTSMLDVIASAWLAIASRGVEPKIDSVLRRGQAQGRIETTWALSSDEMRRASAEQALQSATWSFGEEVPSRVECDDGLESLLRGTASGPPGGAIEYFQSSRRLTGRAPRPFSMPSPSDARGRPGGARDTYEDIPWMLADQASAGAARLARQVAEQGVVLRTEESDPLTPFKEIIKAILPDLRLIEADIRDGKVIVRFMRRDGAMVTLDELSDSERQAVLFGVALRRAPLRDAIVLVDSPELHIGSQDQWRFFEALAGLTHGNQLIAATGSEPILQMARASVAVDLSIRRNANTLESAR